MRSRYVLGAALAASTFLAACSGSSSTLPSAGMGPTGPAPMAIPNSTNVIVNGNFTTGKLGPWKAFEIKYKTYAFTAAAKAKISTAEKYTGSKYSAVMGTFADPAPAGNYGIEQTVTVPKNGTLTWWYWGSTTDTAQYGKWEAGVLSGGAVVECTKNFLKTGSAKGWVKGSCSLKKYGGKKETIVLDMFDNGYSKVYNGIYFGGVSLQ